MFPLVNFFASKTSFAFAPITYYVHGNTRTIEFLELQRQKKQFLPYPDYYNTNPQSVRMSELRQKVSYLEIEAEADLQQSRLRADYDRYERLIRNMKSLGEDTELYERTLELAKLDGIKYSDANRNLTIQMIKPPTNLGERAKKFWEKHCERLTSLGILGEADVDAFSMLCTLWQRCEEMSQEAKADPRRNRQYLETVKAWQSLARQFGLLRLDRQRSGFRPEEPKDEYGL